MVPRGATLSDLTTIAEENSYPQVSSNTVETINIERYDDKTRFIELQIVRYLVKAMRTNHAKIKQITLPLK